MRVVIAGGGYAGLTAAIYLRRHTPQSHVILIDPKPFFLKKTYLHKTVHLPLSYFCLPYAEIARKFGFLFFKEEIDLRADKMEYILEKNSIPLSFGELSFDFLVLTTGSKPYLPFPVEGQRFVTLREVENGNISTIIKSLLPGSVITLIGGGATSLQFLGELLFVYGKKFHYRLISDQDQLLYPLPDFFHTYAQAFLEKNSVEYLMASKVTRVQDKRIWVTNQRDSETKVHDSDLTLIFTGLKAHPKCFEADVFGRLLYNKKFYPHIFVAGDCSLYPGGNNTLSAQAAVRKGKKVAQNIMHHMRGEKLEPYTYEELGYFVSLGFLQAVGYLFDKRFFLSGPLAYFIKEIAEAQFDLFLKGWDVFIT